MGTGQLRVVLACFAIAESAWIYAALALLGLGTSHGGSPMSMPAVLAVLASAVVISRALLYIAIPDWVALSVQTLIGLLVIWLTVATQVSDGGVEFGWIGRGILSREIEGDYTFNAFAGVLVSVFLWRRGAHMAGLPTPVQSPLNISFRIGIVTLAIAAVVDTIMEQDLNIYSVMFVFLAASLAGLGVGRLLPSSQETGQARAWPQVIGGVVTGVVLTGLFVGLVQNAFLSQVSRIAVSGLGFFLNRVVSYILFAIIYPLAYLVGLIVDGLVNLFGSDELRQPPTEAQEPPPIDQFLEDLQERLTDADQSFVLFDVLQYMLIAVIALVVAFLLVKAFKRRRRARVYYEAGDRESVSAGRSPATDAANLLLGLLPRRLRRLSRGYRLPDGPPGLVDVFRIYYGLLELAGKRGIERAPHETPREFQTRLTSVLPYRLVNRATEAFDRACYGDHPAPASAIAEMRAALEAESRG